MKGTRREFLRIAGLAALGVGAGAAVMAYQPHPHKYVKRPEALTAKRWGMVIDTRKFHSDNDYLPLIEACHSQHNVPIVPPEKQAQEIKWIWLDSFHHVFPHAHNDFLSHELHEKSFPLLCNHCEKPPCVRVCPTQATFKREDGIVMMDMHRCIGCRFCMAGCPYGSRSFNFMTPRDLVPKDTFRNDYPTRMRGVVEKCNFCAELLAEGKLPACVEASNGKLIFGDLEDPHSEIRHVLEHNYTIRRKPDLGTNPSVFYII